MYFCKNTDFKKDQIIKSHFLAHLGIKQSSWFSSFVGLAGPHSSVQPSFYCFPTFCATYCYPSASWRTHISFDCSPPAPSPAQPSNPWKNQGPSLPPVLEPTARVQGCIAVVFHWPHRCHSLGPCAGSPWPRTTEDSCRKSEMVFVSFFIKPKWALFSSHTCPLGDINLLASCYPDFPLPSDSSHSP